MWYTFPHNYQGSIDFDTITTKKHGNSTILQYSANRLQYYILQYCTSAQFKAGEFVKYKFMWTAVQWSVMWKQSWVFGAFLIVWAPRLLLFQLFQPVLHCCQHNVLRHDTFYISCPILISTLIFLLCRMKDSLSTVLYHLVVTSVWAVLSVTKIEREPADEDGLIRIWLPTT